MSKIEVTKSDFTVFWETRIRYYELDPQGIMHNANYLAFYDQAVVEYFRDLDYDYEKEIEETNKDFHTVQVIVQYNKPLYFDEEIEIASDATSKSSRSTSSIFALLSLRI